MTTEQKARPKIRLSRVRSIDLIRGIAAFLMVQGHCIYQTVDSLVPNMMIFRQYPNFWILDFYYWISENFIYSAGWSMFFVIIGLGLSISISSQKLMKQTFKQRFIHVLKRTGILLVIQYVYNLVGFGFLPGRNFIDLLNPITNFQASFFIAEIAIWSFLTFFIMHIHLYYRIAIAVFIAYFGYFVVPILGNMLFYILAGGIFGSYLVNEMIKGEKYKIFKVFLIMGIILVAIGIPLHMLTVHERTIVPWFTDYAEILATPGFILYSIGLIWIIFAIFYYIMDIKKHDYKIFRPFILIGNITLTLYVTHFILLNQMTQSLGLFHYFRLISGWIWNFSLIIFIYIGSVYWARYRFKYSLEWIIRTYT